MLKSYVVYVECYLCGSGAVGSTMLGTT